MTIIVQLDKIRLQADISSINLNICVGENWHLKGPSGVGKTLLLRTLVGLHAPIDGAISVNTQSLAFAFQEPRLVPYLTALENLLLLPHQNRDLFLNEADHLLERAGLSAQRDQPASLLSGGEKQRVNLIRALMAKPKLLLLDEVGASLDHKSWCKIRALAEAYLKQSRATLVQTSHQKDRLIGTPRQYKLSG